MIGGPFLSIINRAEEDFPRCLAWPAKKHKDCDMDFKKIEKKAEGTYITRYDITYQLKNGREKVYEMISRDKELKDFPDLASGKADSVVLIMENETGDKLLLNREFRMAVGDWTYNFPAGLIDAGETPEEAARRELAEETGLTIKRITDTLGNGYSAVGFSNEVNVCVFGVAEGSFKESTSAEEEIEAGWYTKAQIRELLRTQNFAARTQAYCYLWSRSAKIRLRPHHLLCSQGYRGKGYSEAFTRNMDEITRRLRTDPDAQAELVFSSDDLCAMCPNRLPDGSCRSEEKVQRYDRSLVRLFHLEEKTYSYADLIRRIDKEMTKVLLQSICGDCEWYSLGFCADSILAGKNPSKTDRNL